MQTLASTLSEDTFYYLMIVSKTFFLQLMDGKNVQTQLTQSFGSNPSRLDRGQHSDKPSLLLGLPKINQMNPSHGDLSSLFVHTQAAMAETYPGLSSIVAISLKVKTSLVNSKRKCQIDCLYV